MWLGFNVDTNLAATIALLLYTCSSIADCADDELKCYQCDVTDNALCTDNYLKVCPSNQAYDRCMTIVSKSLAGLTISKKCALGPCTLRDIVVNDELGLDDDCDRSKNEYQCHYCCRGDGCNKSTASSLPFDMFLIHIGLLIILIKNH